MSIRQKLLVLLLLFAVTPLVSAALFGRAALNSLGDRLTEETRETLIASQERDLFLISSAYANVIRTRGLEIERGLLLLAGFAENALAQPAPPDLRRGVYDARLDFGALRRPVPGLIDRRSGRAPTQAAPTFTGPVPALPGSLDRGAEGPVHLSYAAISTLFYAADRDITERAREDAAKLSSLLPLCRGLMSRAASPIEGLHLTTLSGAHLAYPGHSAYPLDFDPRRRPWFEAAATQAASGGENATRPVWSGPTVDVRTGELTMSLSQAIVDETGSLIAVVSAESRLATLLEGMPELAEWSEEARGLVTVTADETTADRRTVERLARDAGLDPDLAVLRIAERGDTAAGRDWRSPIDLDLLLLDEPQDRAWLARTMDLRASGIRRVSLDSRSVLLAATPFRPDDVTDGAYLVLIVPTRAVERPADAIASKLAAQVGAQIAVNGAIAAVVIVVVAVAGVFASRSVTRPVRKLAATAERIAAGDLEAKADVIRRDEFGTLAATFNAMVPKLRDRLRMRDSLNLAQDVQRHLLPAEPPQFVGLDVAGLSQYCDETGGDYYDFIELDLPSERAAPRTDGDDGSPEASTRRALAVVVGDVTGHGAAAALLMATARASIRTRLSMGGSLADVMNDVNRQLCRDASEGRFMTMALFLFDPQQSRIRFVNAGHDPAILLDPQHQTADAGHTPRSLDTDAGVPLGVLDDFNYQEQSTPMPDTGALLLLATDGVWEARDPNGEMFGKQRLHEVLSRNRARSADAVCRAVAHAVSTHQADAPQRDDVTLVVVKTQ